MTGIINRMVIKKRNRMTQWSKRVDYWEVKQIISKHVIKGENIIADHDQVRQDNLWNEMDDALQDTSSDEGEL